MIGVRSGIVAAVLLLPAAAPLAGQTTPTTPATSAPATTAAPTTSPTTAAPTTPLTTAPATTVGPTTTPSPTTTTSTTTPGHKHGGTSASTIAIAVIAGVVGLAIITALIAMLVARARRRRWADAAADAAIDARALSAEVQQGIPWFRDPNAASQVWANVDARLGRLRVALRRLGAIAPDEARRAAVGRTSHVAQALQASVETDRRLRVGPPMPSADQLAYSEAVLRQRAAELERAVEDLEARGASA